MQYIKRPYMYFCSGGLLNNTSGDQTPCLLTANHCISRDCEAGTLEAFFQLSTSCNNREGPSNNQITSPRTLGSSGSPVVNASGQVVGQLSGAGGTNLYDVCDNDANATVDGALANYFGEVSSWIDPGGCPDADDDGHQDDACGGSDWAR